jgi:hypothetical protein
MRQQQHPRRIVASLTGVLVPALWLFRASPNLTGTASQCLFEEGGPIALAGDRSAPLSLMSSSSSEQELRGLLVFLSDCGWLLCRGGPGLRAFQEPSGGLNGKRNQRSRRPSDRCDISVEYERLRAGHSRHWLLSFARSWPSARHSSRSAALAKSAGHLDHYVAAKEKALKAVDTVRHFMKRLVEEKIQIKISRDLGELDRLISGL